MGPLEAVTASRLPYCLPLRRVWQWAAGGIDQRRGALLRLEAAEGLVGWGDEAPFPPIGIDASAAAAHAEECARLDLAAQRAGLPLARWLTGGEAAAAVTVNAALGDLATAEPAALEKACRQGFRTLKLKAGTAAPDEELARLRELAAQLPPGVHLRLDANRAWEQAAAAHFLAACADLPIDAVEEPLAQPVPATLGRLQAIVPFALALDESLAELPLDTLLATPPVRRLVLKPARHGGLLASLALARRASEAGMECVVTSALESACGLLAAAHLAAAIDPESQLAHGLATADWFAADTGLPPTILDGRLILPSGPGLGFVPRLS